MRLLQLLSIPSQISGACLSPGTQLSTTAPLTQLVAPVDAQGPWPQVVGTDWYSSSIGPSQSSSMPLQTESLGAGVPGIALQIVPV